MSWLIEIALGVCLIILVSGLVNWVNGYIDIKKRTREGELKLGKQGAGSAGSLEERLAEIERRLTDVQDVMIALSEKFDRWEQEKDKLG